MVVETDDEYWARDKEFYRPVAEDGTHRFVAEARALEDSGIERDMIFAVLIEVAFSLVCKQRLAGGPNLLGLKLFSMDHCDRAEQLLENLYKYTSSHVPGFPTTGRVLDTWRAFMDDLEIKVDLLSPEAFSCLEAFVSIADDIGNDHDNWSEQSTAYTAIDAGFALAFEGGPHLLMRFLKTLEVKARADLSPLEDIDEHTLAVYGTRPC